MVDYAKRVFPYFSFAAICFWVFIALVGLAFALFCDHQLEGFDGTEERVRILLAEREVPQEDRDRELTLLSLHIGSMRMFETLSRVMVGAALLGLLGQAMAFKLIKRLVGISSMLAESPRERPEGDEDSSPPDP